MAQDKPSLSIHPRVWFRAVLNEKQTKQNTAKVRDKNRVNLAPHEKHISQHPHDNASIAHMHKRIAGN